MLDRNNIYHVKELADLCQVSTDVVRHYTRIGLLNPTREPDNGYKLYTRLDVVRLNFIRNAKSLGYTLKEISQLISDSESGESPCPKARKIIKKRIDKNKEHMRQVMALQKRMEEASRKWDELPDVLPVGDSICFLIEQVTTDISKGQHSN